MRKMSAVTAGIKEAAPFAFAVRLCFLRSFYSVFFILTILLVLNPATKAFAVEGTIEASQENGYGRIIFKFDRLPNYTQNLQESIFILQFDETINLVVETIPEKLKDYVGIARIDPDGKAVRLAFNGIYKVNIMEAGAQLYVDILPKEWIGMPPALPKPVLKELGRLAEEAAARAKEEAKQIEESKKTYRMRVRVARQKTFSRISFEWNKFVTVKMSRDGTKATIKFGRRAEVNWGKIKADLPPYLRNIDSKDVADGMQVDMEIDPESSIRGFRENNTYVVDLSGHKSDVEASAEALEKKIDTAQGEKTEPLNQPTKKEGASEEVSIPQETVKNEEDEEGGRPAIKKQDVPIALSRSEFDPHKIDSTEFGDLEEEGSIEKDYSSLDGWGKIATPLELAQQQKIKRQKDLAEKEALEEKLRQQKKESSETQPGSEQADTEKDVEVQVSKTGERLKLSFPFAKSVSSAIFKRGNAVWMIFDTEQEIRTSKIQEQSGPLIKTLDRKSSPGLQIIKMALSRPSLVYANNSDNTWEVIIGDMIASESKPLHLRRVLREDQKSIILVSYEKAGRIHWVKDEDLGDDLAVVTAYAPVRTVMKPQQFVEFDALLTSHGLAVKPKSDDLIVRLRLDEVMISRKAGLTLSSGGIAQYAQGQKPLDARQKGRVGFIDFKNWQQGGIERFAERSGELERSISSAEPNERAKLRFDLARFYMSHQLAPETLAVLRQISMVDPKASADPSLNILRGAANVLLHRYADARKDLDTHGLAHDIDAALWRGLLAAYEKNYNEALKQFSEGIGEIGSYPHELQARFRLGEAEAAIALKQTKRAADALEAIPGIALPKVLEAKADLTRGKYLELIGRSEEALDMYQRVSEGMGETSADAQYHKLALKLQTKKITPEEGIRELEKLSIVWRGDESELRVLRRLAKLYVGRKEYRAAFEMMKNTVTAFPKDRRAIEIQDDMKEVFLDLFLYGKGDHLPPVTALGLYYDFKEMTPVGRMGDELIRRLADRLLAVDLLDQATELLDYQVRNRLHGVGQAQVATRLAMIQLMNLKPVQALKSIRDTRQPELPEDLKRRRDILEARALGEMGRVEGAIDLLAEMTGDDVARLRADAYWNAQRWQQAGEELEKMLNRQWQENKPLSDIERFDILRASVSYSLANDQFALDRLRRKFYNSMIKTADAETFVLVTRPAAERSGNFNAIAKEIASIDTLKAFMKEFRARYDRLDTLEKTPAKPPEKDTLG